MKSLQQKFNFEIKILVKHSSLFTLHSSLLKMLWDEIEDAADIARWKTAVENMITDTEERVGSFYIEKQMRILVDALLSS